MTNGHTRLWKLSEIRFESGDKSENIPDKLVDAAEYQHMQQDCLYWYDISNQREKIIDSLQHKLEDTNKEYEKVRIQRDESRRNRDSYVMVTYILEELAKAARSRYLDSSPCNPDACDWEYFADDIDRISRALQRFLSRGDAAREERNDG